MRVYDGMKNVTCKVCQSKIPVIELRVALDEGSGYSCLGPECSRALSVQQIEKLLDAIDARRLRKKLLLQLDQGTDCPCCRQFAKRYKRKLNAGIARWLIALVKLAPTYPGGWVHVNDLQRALVGGVRSTPLGSADFAKGRFWGSSRSNTTKISRRRTRECGDPRN